MERKSRPQPTPIRLTVTNSRLHPPPTRQHRAQRRHNENGDQPHEPQVTQQVAFSKADDVKRKHEQRELYSV